MAIRLGVVGAAGKFGEVHLQIFSQLARDGKCVLAAISDLNEEPLKKCADEFDTKAYSDYREMLEKENLDGVSIVTPDATHLPIVLDSIAAGCHVLVEKPMDTTVEGCEKMIAAAKQNAKLLEVDFHKRFDPYHIGLKQAIEAGKLGDPLYAYAWMEDRILVPRDWWPDWAPQSSPAWFLASHFIDLYRWLIGRKNAVRVYASGVKAKLPSIGIDTYDFIQSKIDFEDGISFTVDTSWVLPDKFEAPVNQGIRFIGTEGIMEIDSQYRGAEGCLLDEEHQTINMGFKRTKRDKYGNIRYEGYGYESIADFVENLLYLQDGGTLAELEGKYPDGNDGLETTRILCAIHESVKTHEVIQL